MTELQAQRLRAELAGVRSRLADILALAQKNRSNPYLGYTFQSIERHCFGALEKISRMHTRAHEFVLPDSWMVEDEK